ncbi:MAG: dephospho-CoA kinase [Anaerovoracaceae bacterium]|jgi:dephospho-CoA kinase
MKIGITGGIGSGKSTVTACLRELGYTVIDADEISHEITRPGSPVLTRLRTAFGDGIFAAGGALDRAALASLVFDDAAKRKTLDEITHGEIYDIIVGRLNRSDGLLRFVDAPLLFETGLDRETDAVWVVTAAADERVRRVAQRDHVGAAQVRARIAAQLDDRSRCAAADEVIVNQGTKEELRARVAELVEKYAEKALAEKNKANGKT